MRAALQRAHGGPEVVQVDGVGDPEVGPRDVLVAVRAAGLNRLDLLQREGPPLLPGFRLPHIGGMDLAGEVVERGSEVDSVRTGARVLVDPALRCGSCADCLAGDDGACSAGLVVGGNRPGGFAELCAVPAANVHVLPDDVGDEEAATVPTVHATAWHALFTTGGLRAGETLLVHAASSGLSIAAIQQARRAGVRVIATAASEGRAEVAQGLGVEATVVNRHDGWVDAVRELTGGRGVDMVFDHVGPGLFQGSLLALRRRGRLVFCGTTTGVTASFSLPHAYHLGLRLLGADAYSSAEFAAMLADHWQARPRAYVDSVHDLDGIADAHRRLGSGQVVGKVVVRP